MKKILSILVCILLLQNIVSARDYTQIQMKEMKHAQKYGSTQIRTENFKPAKQTSVVKTQYKDPKIITFGDYKTIDDSKYNSKITSDEAKYKEYQKRFSKVNLTNYNAKGNARDYYRIYRIAEKIIRANRLDYQTWRFAITRSGADINAYAVNSNYVNLYTGIIDSFADNDDALAMVIGHELAHNLLGHMERKGPTVRKIQALKEDADTGNPLAVTVYVAFKKKFLIDSKNMEYAADIEGAKLAAKAGYSMDKAEDELLFLEALDNRIFDFKSDHPASAKRLESFRQNVKYFPLDAYQEWGKYNIYNTDVLEVEPSSDRETIVILSSNDRTNKEQYYHPETPEEMLMRFGYMSYLNGEFEKSLKYFNQYFSVNNNNPVAYLYASYAAEEFYNQTKQQQYKTQAKDFINTAYELDKNNKYIKEQYDALK